jgi:hypothetical protein
MISTTRSGFHSAAPTATGITAIAQQVAIPNHCTPLNPAAIISSYPE